MDRFRPGLNLLGLVLAVYAAFFIGYRLSRSWGAVRLDAVRPAYHHDEFVEPRLRTRDPALRARWRAHAPRVRVLKDGRPVTTVGGLLELPLSWDASRAAWIGRWPCPWNAPAGRYALELSEPLEATKALRTGGFEILRRVPRPMPRRMAVATWESARPLASLKVKAPDGTLKDWRGLLDWAQFMGADAFWMLGGQTPGQGRGETWVAHNLPLIPEVARECHRRGLKFGVWAMFSLTMSSENRVPGYEYALEIEDGRPKTTRAISIRDERRAKDVARLLRGFAAIPEVDFVGLDYIRNALGGYELVDDFMAEMPEVPRPANWERMSREERMADFAKRKIARKDMRLVDSWQWWRAHRTAQAIRLIRRGLRSDKPLWAFTLTWDRGRHHGQDPVMFTDAGADACALMMYEADRTQYAQILKDWHAYARVGEVRLIVGNIVDWGLHQRAKDGPGEFRRRLDAAVGGIYADGAAEGLFVHDLERALNGRLGAWSTRDWLDAARAAVLRMKALPASGEKARG
ncbi:MAG: hypothetical protein WC969_05615 [Elusimicrobiota bacterium]|jgi:hypothetical protein